MSPKPILKRSVSEQKTTTHYHAHAVHFPPSPSLTCTFSVYSAAAYDRSPIIVTPNNCALPERGCPGRTYTLEESAPHRRISYARDFHPRALAFAVTRSSSPRSTRTPIDVPMNERPSSSYPALPQLIPDLSSESDESDVSSIIPSVSTISHPAFGIHGLAGPPSKYNSNSYSNVDASGYPPCIDDSNALAFLPHPPSPPSHKYQYAETIDPIKKISRRHRGGRERKHESSRDPDRIPSGGVGTDTQHCTLAFSSLSISSQTSLVTPKKRSSKTTSYSHSQSNFGVDDGCLGGF